MPCYLKPTVQFLDNLLFSTLTWNIFHAEIHFLWFVTRVEWWRIVYIITIGTFPWCRYFDAMAGVLFSGKNMFWMKWRLLARVWATLEKCYFQVQLKRRTRAPPLARSLGREGGWLASEAAASGTRMRRWPPAPSPSDSGVASASRSAPPQRHYSNRGPGAATAPSSAPFPVGGGKPPSRALSSPFPVFPVPILVTWPCVLLPAGVDRGAA